MKRFVGLVGASGVLVMAALPAFAQDVARGQQVFAEQKCSLCHSIGGKGGKVSSLDGVGSRLKADEIEKWITDPKTMAEKAKSTKKPPMKAYTNLSKQDLQALVAYLASLK